MKSTIALLAFALLAGCAGQSETFPEEGEWVRWVCDGQGDVAWRFADADHEIVEVKLEGRDEIYRLRQEPAASGVFYSDGMLAFQSQGDQGFVYWVANDAMVGRGCEAP
ncbi:MliC family protein [Pseudomonas sp. Marseille-QA0892]